MGELDDDIRDLRRGHEELQRKADKTSDAVHEMALAITSLSSDLRAHFLQSDKEEAKFANLFKRQNDADKVLTELKTEMKLILWLISTLWVAVLASLGAFIIK